MPHFAAKETLPSERILEQFVDRPDDQACRDSAARFQGSGLRPDARDDETSMPGSIEETLSASPPVSTRDEATLNPKSSPRLYAYELRTAQLFAGMPEARAALIRTSQMPDGKRAQLDEFRGILQRRADGASLPYQAMFGGFG